MPLFSCEAEFKQLDKSVHLISEQVCHLVARISMTQILDATLVMTFASRFVVTLDLRQQNMTGKQKQKIKDTNTDGFGVCAQEPLHFLFHIRRLNVLQDKPG